MSIAQEIRNAAIHWPTEMSDEAWDICYVFAECEDPWWLDPDHRRVFMLMVAEELSPSLPVDDLTAIAKYLEGEVHLYHHERIANANRLRDLVRRM